MPTPTEQPKTTLQIAAELPVNVAMYAVLTALVNRLEAAHAAGETLAGQALMPEARQVLARYNDEQVLYAVDGTAEPLGERKARVLDWLINNLLTDSQLDVRPPGMSGALRIGRTRQT